MTDTLQNEYRPSSVSAPGETLADLLEERRMTQAELATRMGRPTKTINEIIKGKAAITSETALQLERVLGTPARFWLAREANYQEALERRRQLDALAEEAPWLDELPLADMVRLGWVQRLKHLGAQVAECLTFFAVNSVAAWRTQYAGPLAAFRASEKHEKKVGAVAAWLRQGEREAEGANTQPFDRAKFQAALGEVRALTREKNPEVFVPRLRALCAAAGVAVAFVPAPRGCPASGATRFLSPDKAMLLLSLRHKTNDHLWFTFFHEAGHLHLHSKKVLFVDLEGGLNSAQEDEANHFARDLLIPPQYTQTLRPLRSAAQVTAFAERVGVHPGIVVGRMQKEGWLPWTHLNGLKLRYTWAERGGPDA
ncbi:HigA family addiction module antitoxin [Myxococcota bacterium]|nr:HigA family addiction module antitoxin [Myxococcota bacterium]